jgi:hypothetical protein
MRIIPKSKLDIEACENLSEATDDDVNPHIYELLIWIQDLNWPVARPVAERLSRLGDELIEPILTVLDGDDEIWKYWVVSHLLHIVNHQVYSSVEFKLNRIKSKPTPSEIEEEVYESVCELISSRKNA